MSLDNICIFVMALFALRGWLQGFLRTACGLGGMVLAYALSYALHRPVGGLIADHYQLSPLTGGAVAGLAVFALVTIVASVAAFFYVRRRLHGKDVPDEVRERDKDNGALLGLAQGILFILFLLVALSIVPRGTRLDTALGLSESQMVSAVRTFSPDLFGSLFKGLTGDETGSKLLVGALRDPEGATQAVRDIMSNRSVQELTHDPDVRQHVTKRDAESLARDPRILALARDPEFRASLRRLGLSDDDLVYDPDRAAKTFGELLQALDRMEAATEDTLQSGKLPAALDTPEIRTAIKEGDLQKVLEQLGPFALLFQETGAP